MIVLSTRDGAVLLPLRVLPGARRAGIVGEHAGRLKVAVQAPPERGRANQAVVELLAEALGVRTQQLAVVMGELARDKTVAIRGLDPAQLGARLASTAASAVEFDSPRSPSP